MSNQEGQKRSDQSETSRASSLPTHKSIQTREEIRRLLRLKFRPAEICEELGLSRTRYYDHLKAIRKEDQKFIDSLRGANFASSVRLTIEALEDTVRDLIVISRSAKNDADKIRANELRYQIELDILNVEKVGPSAVPIGTRMTQARDLHVSTIQDQSKQ